MSSQFEQRMRSRRRPSKQRFAAAKPQAQAQQAPRSREQEQEEARGIMGRTLDGAMGALRQIDDSTQAFARDKLLRLPTDGTELAEDAFMSGPRAMLGHTVFAARNKYEGDNTLYRGDGTTGDNIGLGLTRALQGGTITAAGAGLAALTNQFGSQADYQEPNQLSL